MSHPSPHLGGPPTCPVPPSSMHSLLPCTQTLCKQATAHPRYNALGGGKLRVTLELPSQQRGRPKQRPECSPRSEAVYSGLEPVASATMSHPTTAMRRSARFVPVLVALAALLAPASLFQFASAAPISAGGGFLAWCQRCRGAGLQNGCPTAASALQPQTARLLLRPSSAACPAPCSSTNVDESLAPSSRPPCACYAWGMRRPAPPQTSASLPTASLAAQPPAAPSPTTRWIYRPPSSPCSPGRVREPAGSQPPLLDSLLGSCSTGTPTTHPSCPLTALPLACS